MISIESSKQARMIYHYEKLVFKASYCQPLLGINVWNSCTQVFANYHAKKDKYFKARSQCL